MGADTENDENASYDDSLKFDDEMHVQRVFKPIVSGRGTIQSRNVGQEAKK